VQRALVANGFTLRGGVTGRFQKATRTTLRNFQRVVGIPVTGVVDMRTAQVLKLTAPAGKSVTAPQNASFPLAGKRLPKRGNKGSTVRVVQQALAATGLTVRGGIDGHFGFGTTETIKTFQRIKGLTVNGLLDNATAVALGLVPPAEQAAVVPAPAPTTTVPVAQVSATQSAAPALTTDTLPSRGARGQSVVLVQQALINAGITVKGGADGIFGVGTAAAISRFQDSKGFSRTGRLDVRTALALGLVATPPVQLAAFPMQGRCSYSDTWHAPRGDRKHLGVDIIGSEGLLIYAVADGVITKTYTEGRDKLTGNGLRLTTADGTYFFYGHLQRLADGITVGTQVKAGQVLGTNGKTGNTSTPHLHFEVHPQGGAAVNPTAIVAAVDGCNVTAPRP
jgi:murein DD-endopeptidase MepM/ murein hydrolase activator NlpD